MSLTVVDTTADPNNTPPIAQNDHFEIFSNPTNPLVGELLGNDGDPDGDVITINTTPVTPPASGMLTINPNGTFEYTPEPGFIGEVTFEYEITDSSGASSTAIVTINVQPDPDPNANDAPDANDDAAITQVNTPVTGNALTNDTDVNGDSPLTVVSVDGIMVPLGGMLTVVTPNGGTLEISDDGTYTYEPADGFVGTEEVTYTIDDGEGGTDTATIFLSVFNTPPQIEDDINNTSVNVSVDGNVLTNDTSDPGETLVIGDGSGNPIIGRVTFTTDAGGTIEINPDGSYTYTPPTDFVGDDSITIEVCDENGACVESELSLTVVDTTADPNNTPPIAQNDHFETFSDPTSPGTLVGELLGNDGDPDGDVITINTTPVTPPVSGILTINPNGTFEYTPAPGFSGEVTFEYAITDPSGAISTAIATINVQPDSDPDVNDAPDANDDAAITQVNTPVAGNALANDTDVNGDSPLTVVSVDGIMVPLGGMLTVVTPNGGTLETVSYTHLTLPTTPYV